MKVATTTERLQELFDSDPRNDSTIAKDLGVSRQALSAWKLGVRSPKRSMIVKIAEAFGVSLDWLIGFDVDKYPVHQRDYNAELQDRIDKLQTLEAKLIARGVDSLSKQQREQALDILKAVFKEFKELEGKQE